MGRSCVGRYGGQSGLRRLRRTLLAARCHRRVCAALPAIAVATAVSATLPPAARLIAVALFGSTRLLQCYAIRLLVLFGRFALLTLASSWVARRAIRALLVLSAFVARASLAALFIALFAAPVTSETLIRATFRAPAETITVTPLATFGPV